MKVLLLQILQIKCAIESIKATLEEARFEINHKRVSLVCSQTDLQVFSLLEFVQSAEYGTFQ